MRNISTTSQELSRRSFLRIAFTGAATIIVVPSHAYASPSSPRTFTDSLGRSINVEGVIEKITPLGVHAQTLLTTLYPNGLVSIAKDVSEDALDYSNAGLDDINDLPITGGLTSAATNDIETDEIKGIHPDLLLDVGLPYEGLQEDLEELQTQTGIPVFFIDISFGCLPAAYRKLGELLNCTERAEELASHVNNVYRLTHNVLDTSCHIFYAPKQNGITAKESIRIQIDAISFTGATPITQPYNYTNQTVDIALLNDSDVDIVVFDDTEVLNSLISGDIYDDGSSYEIWYESEASASGNYAISPALMHSWFGSPVLLQGLGLLWLYAIICPQKGCDLIKHAQTFYTLFYELDVSDEKLHELIGCYREGGYNNE